MVSVAVFGRALDRAVDEGVKLRPVAGRPGLFCASSGTVPGRWYRNVSVEWCPCPGGKGASICKHRALVAYVTGRVEELVGRVAYDRDAAMDETYREVLAA
jgi:hypothetical protein